MFFNKIFYSLVIIAMGMFGLQTMDARIFRTKVERVSVTYGQSRPFSFYYPYSYQYYYPRPEYGGGGRGSSSCYWLYTNGTYVYYCG